MFESKGHCKSSANHKSLDMHVGNSSPGFCLSLTLNLIDHLECARMYWERKNKIDVTFWYWTLWVDGFTITVWIAQSFIEGALRIIFYLAQTSIGKWHFLFYRRILFRSPQEMVFLIKSHHNSHYRVLQSFVIQCIALCVIIKP